MKGVVLGARDLNTGAVGTSPRLETRGPTTQCSCAGIGRQAGLRSQCRKRRGGSSPPMSTIRSNLISDNGDSRGEYANHVQKLSAVRPALKAAFYSHLASLARGHLGTRHGQSRPGKPGAFTASTILSGSSVLKGRKFMKPVGNPLPCGPDGPPQRGFTIYWLSR